MGDLIRTNEGQFIPGRSGNKGGRPKGSKNKITVQKLMAEEAWREANAKKIEMVLDQIVDDALDGDKSARKLIWDACISKAQVSEDKSAGQKQQITVHRMQVVPRDDVDDNTEGEDDGEAS